VLAVLAVGPRRAAVGGSGKGGMKEARWGNLVVQRRF